MINLFNHGKIITVLQYFTDKFDDYWHILYPITALNDRNKNSYLYFYDISRKATDYTGEFTDEGIYLFQGYDGQYHIHALEIAQYSLACWLAWQNNKENIWLEKALLHCDWLIKHQESDGSWHIGHKNPKYSDLPSPWSSALTQGLAISSLLRAYRYTDKADYFNAAIKGAIFLEIPIEFGGLKRSFDEFFIYEEYPRPELSGVLNGYISSIFGIYELSLMKHEYKLLYKENISNLIKILPKYNLEFWSLYSLDGTISSGFYQRYVMLQLTALSYSEPQLMPFINHYKQQLEHFLYPIIALWKKLTV